MPTEKYWGLSHLFVAFLFPLSPLFCCTVWHIKEFGHCLGTWQHPGFRANTSSNRLTGTSSAFCKNCSDVSDSSNWVWIIFCFLFLFFDNSSILYYLCILYYLPNWVIVCFRFIKGCSIDKFVVQRSMGYMYLCLKLYQRSWSWQVCCAKMNEMPHCLKLEFWSLCPDLGQLMPCRGVPQMELPEQCRC